MAYEDLSGCEPLRAWGRLEPRARRVDFAGALQAKIHDPLWMLARQWQFGEFKGEDTGSAILATLSGQVTPVTGMAPGMPADGAGFDAWSDHFLPLEVHVERMPIDWRNNPTQRAAAGRHFRSLLEAQATSLTPEVAPFDSKAYLQLFAIDYPLSEKPLDRSPANAVALAYQEVRSRAQRLISAMSGRVIDGHALALAELSNAVWTDELSAHIHPDHRDIVRRALSDFASWYASLYVEPANDASTTWVDSQLEYQFACALPRDQSAMVLHADQYIGGQLDWHAFDHGGIPEVSLNSSTTPCANTVTVIPTPAEFAGMPNARWWEFEDASVDLGAIRADTTDVVKILVAEFALLFGNNWLVVPYRQMVGSLAEIKDVVVTDVFGFRTIVKPANSSDGEWTRWDMFSLSPKRVDGGRVLRGQHLFLPPALSHTLESKPVEAVAFMRDEMANLVWGVETTVSDGDGRGRDGREFARKVRSVLTRYDTSGNSDPGSNETSPAAPPLRFQLGTTVPENWIPFLPVHAPEQTRSIRLQRGSMPRFSPQSVAPIRPVTSILRSGLRESDNHQDRPMYVNEEEVPRTGVCVEATMQRARWFGGSTFVWQGRRVTLGRGEGGSGLRFDVVEPSPKGSPRS